MIKVCSCCKIICRNCSSRCCCADSTSISILGFSEFHFISCSDKPTRVLSGLRWSAVLCQKRQTALKVHRGRKTCSAFCAVLDLIVCRGRSWCRTALLYGYCMPEGLYKPPLWPGNGVSFGLLSENLSLCKIFVQGTWLPQSTSRSPRQPGHQPTLPNLWSKLDFSRWPNWCYQVKVSDSWGNSLAWRWGEDGLGAADAESGFLA